MRELQTREIRPEDYELLLSLESASAGVALPKYLAVSFERMLPPEKKAVIDNLRDTPPCSFCNQRIEAPGTATVLRNCDHFMHKGCLEDMFRLKKIKCGTCEAVIAEGFEKSLQIVKYKKPAKKKNKELEEVKQKVL
jgi:cytidine deaminase